MGNSFQKISHLSLGDRAMAVPADVQEEIKELLDPANTTGVHVKLEKILLSLEKVGLAYKAMISPREIMCHPENRGTSMCNAHNVHLKGTQVLQSGLKKDLLPPNSLGLSLQLDLMRGQSN